MIEIVMMNTAELARAMFSTGDRSTGVMHIADLIPESEQKKTKDGIIYFIKQDHGN